MGGAQVRTTMARVIAEACTGEVPPNPGAVWLTPLADHLATSSRTSGARTPADRRSVASRQVSRP